MTQIYHRFGVCHTLRPWEESHFSEYICRMFYMCLEQEIFIFGYEEKYIFLVWCHMLLQSIKCTHGTQFSVKSSTKYCKSFVMTLFFIILVPVIKNTIGQHTSRVVYYSETVDASIPTEDTGVPNTESGKINRSYL